MWPAGAPLAPNSLWRWGTIGVLLVPAGCPLGWFSDRSIQGSMHAPVVLLTLLCISIGDARAEVHRVAGLRPAARSR